MKFTSLKFNKSFYSVTSARLGVQSQFEYSSNVVINVQWGILSIAPCSQKNVFANQATVLCLSFKL